MSSIASPRIATSPTARTVKTTVASPKPVAWQQQDSFLQNTHYYAKQGIDIDTYKNAMTFVKPEDQTIKYLFDLFQLDPHTSRPARRLPSKLKKGEVRQPDDVHAYIVDEHGNLEYDEVGRISKTAYPIINIEIYKFLNDVIKDIVAEKDEEGQKINPTQVIKALHRTNYYDGISNYLDYFSIYQGFDIDAETAKIELNLTKCDHSK